MAFRLSGSYPLPLEINLAGSLISNNGYPYQSSYSITRAFAAGQGVTLTRATQIVALSERGDERFDAVTMIDVRLSRAFNFGSRSFTPQIDFFNITNADTTTALNNQVGTSYLVPERDPVAAHHPRRLQPELLGSHARTQRPRLPIG